MTTRARKLVQQAGRSLRTHSLRTWLLWDEKGTWEQTAQELLDSSLERAVSLGLTPEQHEEAVVIKLQSLAVEAAIQSHTK